MPSARLTIDTSMGATAGPSSSSGAARITKTDRVPGPSSALYTASLERERSASTTATSAPTSDIDSPSTSYFPSTSLRRGTAPVQDSLPSDPDYNPEQYVLALHDFAPLPQQQNVTCLTFQAGQVIRVLNRDSSGWWDGELDGRRGWFPSNYVTADVGLLQDEALPNLLRRAKNGGGHSHSASAGPASPWSASASAKSISFIRTDHRPMASESSLDAYCPPLMVPLLRALSVLQNAVRTNRSSHFQPSIAYIISSVRSLLTDLGCLAREAAILKRHPLLAKERKRILSDLALLVTQSRKASEGELNAEERSEQAEGMIRGSGQLFAHVRDFLAIATQCGLDFASQSTESDRASSDSEDRWGSHEGTLVRVADTPTPVADDFGPYGVPKSMKAADDSAYRQHQRDDTMTPGRTRARSMSDIRGSKPLHDLADAPPVPRRAPALTVGRAEGKMAASQTKRISSGPAVLHKSNQASISSVSSSSSGRSVESIGTPSAPSFPTGPSTTPEVMEALRHSHDHYLSTIAAFIGHAHSHSRTSHASSTGHMYELVREVVEMVCKLLTIVEAVLRHPDIPPQRAHDLRAAKEGLYNVTSTLADAVRQLTTAPLPGVTEEEEKSTLLRSATNALKAGSDCVNAVKKCLQRPSGHRPLIIELPGTSELDSKTFTPSKFSHAHSRSDHLRAAARPSALREIYRANGVEGDVDDLTVPVQTVPLADTPTRPEFPPSPERSQFPIADDTVRRPDSFSDNDNDASSPTPASNKPLPPARTSEEHQDRADMASLSSPVSLVPTDDGTTWEGSFSNHQARRSLEEKLRQGELPALPTTAPPAPPPPAPLSWLLSHDHPSEDVAYNSEGQLVGATLSALVERMTPHDALAEPAFAAVFFLTFRQFTTSVELMETLIARYNLLPPQGLPQDEMLQWQHRKGVPVRLRVANVLKIWLESYWRPSLDLPIIPALANFTREALSPMFPIPSQQIMELVRQRSLPEDSTQGSRFERARDPGFPLNPPTFAVSEIPRPVLKKDTLAHLRNKNYSAISLIEFDTLELARQLTVMECNLYCAIQPEEVLETGQSDGSYPRNVKAVTSLSTVITGWVAESILDEPDTKKRTALMKYFIKVADRCTTLQNFSTPRSILAALDSSTISRLHQTWTGLPQKNRSQLEALRKLSDHSRNYHEYRTRLKNTAPPAIPFLGLYLTDITFCREGNPSHRSSPQNPDKKLLNFNKYHKLARIVQDMQRFQVPYNLKEIPEVQEYLKDAFEQSKNRTDLQDLYRRSLLVEPKRSADQPPPPPSGDMRQLFQWATRSQASVTSQPSKDEPRAIPAN
ncbi:REM and RasGEF domain-containing protein [Phanerochaete sordida]|uniref:REM and RasGEF domain-containing protein n=1 Tax=Phanerochaete sordida TaxID=48140 RepID=A0A9P3G4S4_9APHY|nr:REM and RasGEF domain-containing protein [Phanerochaete sordida]